jgi:hypothetical protein
MLRIRQVELGRRMLEVEIAAVLLMQILHRLRPYYRTNNGASEFYAHITGRSKDDEIQKIFITH